MKNPDVETLPLTLNHDRAPVEGLFQQGSVIFLDLKHDQGQTGNLAETREQ